MPDYSQQGTMSTISTQKHENDFLVLSAIASPTYLGWVKPYIKAL